MQQCPGVAVCMGLLGRNVADPTSGAPRDSGEKVAKSLKVVKPFNKFLKVVKAFNNFLKVLCKVVKSC